MGLKQDGHYILEKVRLPKPILSPSQETKSLPPDKKLEIYFLVRLKQRDYEF